MPLVLILSFYASLIKSLLALGFARLYTPQHIPGRDLTGQTAIITGANSGIGLSMAVALAQQGASVCLACRDPDRGTAAVEYVLSQCPCSSSASIYTRALDVGNLESVRSFCRAWEEQAAGPAIDMLVHNAGIASPPREFHLLDQERAALIYRTNFLGSFLMTRLLETHLTPGARVVMTSSTGSYSAASYFLGRPSRNTTPVTPGLLSRMVARVRYALNIKKGAAAPYALTKAQQILFAQLLQRRFDALAGFGNRCTAHAFTPGFASTPIFGKLDMNWRTWVSDPLFALLKVTEKWLAVPVQEGAKTGVWLASHGDVLGSRGKGGSYWERMTKRTSVADVMDEGRKKEEWEGWERDAGAIQVA